MSDSLQPHGLYSPWNSPGHNTGVGNLSLLQGVFPTQRSNLGLLHCRRILNQLSHKGSQEYWRVWAIPSAEDLPNPGVELGSPALQVDSLPTELSEKPPSEVKITQSCPALCDQARILEWVAFPLSGGSPQPRD